MAVDREFVYIVLAPSLGFGSFCLSLVLPLALFGMPWGARGLPLAPFGPPWGPLWLPLALFGMPWAALGLPLAPFGPPWGPLWLLPGKSLKIGRPGGSQSRFFDATLQRNWGSGIHPWNPWNPRKWCHQLLLGTSLPHAPGVRMM